MIPKHVLEEIERLNANIGRKKDRIDKLKRLAKLAKNEDLISEYDIIINSTTTRINAVIGAGEPMDAHKEQVFTHGQMAVRAMAEHLKSSICSSQAQIDILNNSIEDDNIKITQFKNQKTTTGGKII